MTNDQCRKNDECRSPKEYSLDVERWKLEVERFPLAPVLRGEGWGEGPLPSRNLNRGQERRDDRKPEGRIVSGPGRYRRINVLRAERLVHLVAGPFAELREF